MTLDLQKMWWWIFVSLNFISKLHGYSHGNFPEACDSMRPLHGPGGTGTPPQTSEPPFMVSNRLGSNVGDPITVSLQSKHSVPFIGFMLEARELSLNGEGPPLGKFIITNSGESRLLRCGNSEGSAVSNTDNREKRLINVNWTAEGDERDIIFRATFCQMYRKCWERVNVIVLRPMSTPKPEATTAAATTTTTQMTTTMQVYTTQASTNAENDTNVAVTTTTTQMTTTMQVYTTQPSTNAENDTNVAVTTTTTQMTTTMQVYTTQASTNAENDTKIGDIVMMCLNSVFVDMKMQISNIIMAVHPRRSSNHYLLKGIYIGLVTTVLLIGFIEWVIAVLPFGPSHELNEHCELALRVCFPFHHLFTNAFLHVKIKGLIDEWVETRRELWFVLIAQTVLIGLTIVWDILLCNNKRALLQIVKDKSKHHQGHQIITDRCSAVTVTVTVISEILVVGITSLSVAIIVGLFLMQKN
ncbi:putative ferric-chelate reductase 1 isoform X3 [Girardinichthys multiradiatus]|uniref:putative ferric-chelate reductase 1 isoform X3 n=1 Tax=Girardinichthys multiradiatus TaxID=208333 RepID=UPI001FAD34AB|nr:putative ferric-chelate reductase 1 isoform X3 [Girardinichthys multiradiatus]